ncbi:Clp protease ClpP [Rouxiella sp. T17]|uniref:ClpP-like prohead protease/major capsid protein fusion protein n=1 Tax=Rouxiella sp. T17 TaxID=3085684 RepID=UPI002FCC2855
MSQPTTILPLPKTRRKSISLIKPQASHSTNFGADSWYQITAAAQTGGAVAIYLHDLIGAWGISAQQFLGDCRTSGVFEAAAIDLHIHSAGGDLMDGFAIFNTLGRLTVPINIYIDGIAASMASVIACLPNATVHMPENAWMMIHKPWGGVAGDADEIRHYAEWMDRNESLLVSAYENKTGLAREEIAALLKAETWMNGVQAKEKGFADVIEPALTAAASLNTNKLKDYKNMPQQITALFEARAAAPEMPAPTAPTQNIDINALATQLQQQMHAANVERVDKISAVFTAFPQFDVLKSECIADVTCTDAGAQEKLLKALAAGTTPTAGYNAHIFAGNGNLVGDSIRASVMSRAGYAEAEKDNAYSGYTLRELARASLLDRGISLSGQASPMAMVGLAFTHSRSDFGSILMDVAHKAALLGWDEAEETFDRWTRKGTLTDFKTSHRVGLNSIAALRQVREGAEYKYITVGDKAEEIALATYGELFSITRQTIINDDLHMLTRIPMSMGSAARATVGDLVYAVLTSNGKMKDGKTLFCAEHKNQVAAALDIEGLDLGRRTMLLQESNGRKLNIRPAFMLVPVALESRANQLIKSTSVPGVDANSGIINPIQNFATVIAEARLDAANNKEWYLAAAQGRDTLEVAYLDGVDAPYLEQQQGFTIDGAAFKVRIDAGVAPLDHRGLIKSTGNK